MVILCISSFDIFSVLELAHASSRHGREFCNIDGGGITRRRRNQILLGTIDFHGGQETFFLASNNYHFGL